MDKERKAIIKNSDMTYATRCNKCSNKSNRFI